MSSISRDSSGVNARSSRDQPKQRDQPVGRDAVVDAVLERALVLDAAANVDAVEPELVETALHRLEPDEVEQQVRRQVAARRDHVLRELGRRASSCRSRRAPRSSRRGRRARERATPSDGAEEAVAHVQPRLRQQPAVMNRRVDAEQDRDLDRARGVEPAVGVPAKARPRLRVVDGDARARARQTFARLRRNGVEVPRASRGLGRRSADQPGRALRPFHRQAQCRAGRWSVETGWSRG